MILISILSISQNLNTTLITYHQLVNQVKCSTVHSKLSTLMLDLFLKTKIFIAKVGKLKMHDLENILDILLMTTLIHLLSMLFRSQMLKATTSHHSTLNTLQMELLIPEFHTHLIPPMLARTLLLFISPAFMLRLSELL